ncbi:MAG: hypothetical protein BMS9Abin32_718 [Gammaproteobacteria bacterium]|nr:MAG: hypothetical protein BMS9Abin32_718 [Gammaproteobacteria bacterium]
MDLNKLLLGVAGSAVLLLAGATTAQRALAADDNEQARTLAFTCMGCHGIEGYHNAYPSYPVPRLGGQRAAYIEAALRAYRSGSRPHATMRAQGSSLSDADIALLASYFESLGAARDQLDAAAVAGVDGAAICVTCHGAAGAEVEPQPPTLSGQQADYLVHALQQYRDGSRGGTIMSAFAGALSDADMRRLASFYAAQDGLHTPAGSK